MLSISRLSIIHLLLLNLLSSHSLLVMLSNSRGEASIFLMIFKRIFINSFIFLMAKLKLWATFQLRLMFLSFLDLLIISKSRKMSLKKEKKAKNSWREKKLLLKKHSRKSNTRKMKLPTRKLKNKKKAKMKLNLNKNDFIYSFIILNTYITI